ncbi:MAG: Rpn family recombination-promoting nuclease/putative transposase [Bacteroidales bacterium]
MNSNTENDYTMPREPLFINPFTDFGFKKIFGEEPNKDLLIDFLNELLSPHKVSIKDLTYKKTEHLGKSDMDRNVVFDLYCENEKGEKFIVEMQKAKQSFFKDRTVFYSTFPIQEQGVKGSNWNFQLKAVYAVGILDFTFDNTDDHDKPIITHVQLLDKKTCKVFCDKLTYIFVQMPHFNKTIDELETHLDKWLFVLKNLDKFDRIPEKIKEKIFLKVFQIAQYHKMSKEERMAYEDSLKYYRDLKNSLDTAKEEGFALAEDKYRVELEESLLKQEEERRQKEEERRQKEEALKKHEKSMHHLTIAIKNMLAKDIPVEEIANMMDIPVKEVKRLGGL